MIADVNAEPVQPTSTEARTLPTSLKLTLEGGYQLTYAEKTSVELQIREA